eukprot:1926506-Ditylum_brightwellii.AAC.1
MGDAKFGDGFSSSIDGCLVSNAKWMDFFMLYHGDSRDGEGKAISEGYIFGCELQFVISTGDGDMKGVKPVAIRDRSEWEGLEVHHWVEFGTIGDSGVGLGSDSCLNIPIVVCQDLFIVECGSFSEGKSECGGQWCWRG